MNFGSWIVIAAVALCAALAIRSIVRSHKSGKTCSCGCSGCSGNPETASCSAADKMVACMQQSMQR